MQRYKRLESFNEDPTIDDYLILKLFDTMAILYTNFEVVVEDIQINEFFTELEESKGKPTNASNRGWSLEKELKEIAYLRGEAHKFFKKATISGYYDYYVYQELKDIAIRLTNSYNIIYRTLASTLCSKRAEEMVYYLNQIIDLVNYVYDTWNDKVILFKKPQYEIIVNLKSLKTLVKGRSK